MSKNPKGFTITPVNSTEQIARLYDTNICHSKGLDVTLNSGGWLTNHTKKCMNIFLSPFNARVFQKKGEWFVTYLNECMTEVTVPFQDNMRIETGV